LRIAYLCSDFDIPLLGPEGCSIHVRGLTDALVAQGHDVVVVAPCVGDGPARMRARVLEPGLEGLDAAEWAALEPELEPENLERDLRLILYNHRLRASGLVERERPDAIVERYSLFGSTGLALARKLGIPFVLEVNTHLRLEQDGYEKFVLTGTAEAVETELLREADAVVAVSGWLRDWVVDRGADPARVHVIPNGVDAALFAEAADGPAARARYGLDGGPVLGFVGSFQPWHDVAGLLDAFALVRAREPQARLLVVGHGEARAAAEERARELGKSVVFAGRVAHEDVPGALAAMDVAVAPYGGGQELGFLPIKLFEYMAAGRPTVAADVGRIAELVEDGRTGLLYPPGDPAALAARIETLLADPERARSLGAAARERVLAEHTWDAVAVRVAAIAAG
jgi:glycosyltransferase involved in cell wall biosynthesis